MTTTPLIQPAYNVNTSFVDELLERTADWRTRVGQNLLSVNLMGPKVTLNDYKKYLSALFHFVNGFEKYIFPELSQFVPDLEKRKKMQLIKNDLSKLGQTIKDTGSMPESYFRSMYTDPYAALGALYVLESSTLGGELIQQHIQNTLKEPVTTKLSYFVAHGVLNEFMWDSFFQDFCKIAERSDKQENIIDGALRTLRLLDQLMTDESLKA